MEAIGEPTEMQIERALWRWDRATQGRESPQYFRQNWRAVPELRAFVAREVVPRAGCVAFDQQMRSARRRGIPFLFDLAGWWAWWQVDGRWERRGMGADALVMARKGDAGPYSPENVYCASHSQNSTDIARDKRERALRAASEGITRRTAKPTSERSKPEKRPRERPIITPTGRFESATLAAEAYGISVSAATEKARKCWKGWSYEAR